MVAPCRNYVESLSAEQFINGLLEANRIEVDHGGDLGQHLKKKGEKGKGRGLEAHDWVRRGTSRLEKRAAKEG